MCEYKYIKKTIDYLDRCSLLVRIARRSLSLKFIRWIKVCILNALYSINIDGALDVFFACSKGFRKYCLFTPIIFAIIMDGLLFVLIDQAYMKGKLTCNQSAPKISHLFFIINALYKKLDELISNPFVPLSLYIGHAQNSSKS